MKINELSEFLAKPTFDKSAFGNITGLTNTLAQMNKVYSPQVESILTGIRLVNNPFTEALRFTTSDNLKSIMNFSQGIDLGIKEFIKNNQIMVDSIRSSALAASVAAETIALRNTAMLEGITLAQKNLGANFFNSIQDLNLNQSFRNGLLDVIADVTQNSEKYRALLDSLEAEDELKNSESFKAVSTWVGDNFQEVQNQLIKYLLAFIILNLIWDHILSDSIEKHILGPNVCIARSGCNLREQGSRESKRVACIPAGAELKVVDDRGRWKKIVWEKDSGDVLEGWVSSSLLKWKIGNAISKSIEEVFSSTEIR